MKICLDKSHEGLLIVPQIGAHKSEISIKHSLQHVGH